MTDETNKPPADERAAIAAVMASTVNDRLERARTAVNEAYAGVATPGGEQPEEQPEPERRHGWKPGQSGNPKGRPHGSRNKASIIAEQLMAGELEALTKSVVVSAMAGDMQAMRLVLERVLPPRKGRPVQFDLPPVKTAADVSEATGAVLASVAAGELSPEEGQAVAGILETRRRAIETTELAAEVAAIKQSLQMKGAL